MKSVVLGDGTRFDLTDEEYTVLSPLINKYNEAYGYGYKFNIHPPKWQDFLDGYADDVVASYAKGVEFVRPSQTAQQGSATSTQTPDVVIPADVAEAATSSQNSNGNETSTSVITTIMQTPGGNGGNGGEPGPAKKTNWLPWICGGIALVLLLSASGGKSKSKRR